MGNCNIVEEATPNQIEGKSKYKEIKLKKYDELEEKFKDMPEWPGNTQLIKAISMLEMELEE